MGENEEEERGKSQSGKSVLNVHFLRAALGKSL